MKELHDMRIALNSLTLVTAAACATALSAQNFQPTILYVNEPGHVTNVVPGLGVPFAPGTSTNTFVRPWISSDGSQWIIEADADTGSTTNDNVYILNGALFLQEGTPAPWAPGENVGTLDDQVGINNSGQVLVTNNTSSTVNDDYVALFTPGPGWTILAQEAGTIAALTPSTWDDTIESPLLTNAGTAGWDADLIDGGSVTTATDSILVLGGAIIAQSGVTIPASQAGGAMDTWGVFDFSDFDVSPDGANTLIQGDTNAATTDDDILVFNGTVVLQENQIVPGSPFANPIDGSGIVRSWLDQGGNWYAAGNNDTTEQDWVVRNGAVVAFSDGMNDITGTSGEHWDDTSFSDCFFAFDGNDSGAFVIGGVTDAPTTSNGVLVYDDGSGNRVVALREGDPIDLDANGLFDDDRFFNTIGNDDVRLTNDGAIWFTATLRNGLGTTTNHSLFRLRMTDAECAVRNGSGVNPLDYACTSLPILGTTWSTSIATNADTAGHFIVFTPVAAVVPFPFPLFGGEILVDLSLGHVILNGTSGVSNVPLPLNPALDGAFVATQCMRLDTPGGVPTIQLLNAIDLTLGD